MDEVDYLIVGAGLAGMCVAEKLLTAENKISVIDLPAKGSSTLVSAGIINPITGMRFVRSWNFPLLEFHFKKFYESLEDKLNCSFFKSIEIDQCLKDEKEVSEWLERTADPFYQFYIDKEIWKEVFHNGQEFYFGKIRGAYLLQLDTLIPNWKRRLQDHCIFYEQEFSFDDFKINTEEAYWKNLRIKKGIVFTEGYRVSSNPFFGWLPVVPLKGECSKLNGVGFQREALLKMNYTLCPAGENQMWCGSSFKINDQSLDFDESERKRQNSFITSVITQERKYSVTQHVGIRPATRDRKPIIGAHPIYKNLYVLNGFGTKGFSLAPYVSDCFIEYLQGKAAIPEEISIDRLKRKTYWPNSLSKF